MGVAVLPPQNPHHHHNHNQHFNHRNAPRSTRKRCNSNSPPPAGPIQTRPATPQVTTQVRILKRGEILPPPPQSTRAQPGSVLPGFYAGSGFVTSPPPSSVPLPAFFTAARRNCGLGGLAEADIATGLRNILKMQ